MVEDLGSKNGTYVNDRRVEGPTPVVDGDQIRFGSLALHLPPRTTSRYDAIDHVASQRAPAIMTRFWQMQRMSEPSRLPVSIVRRRRSR